MLSIVIPTLNAERHLARTLTALVPAALDGMVSEVVISDGGSTDRTLKIADEAGCEIVKGEPGRGAQLARGAQKARMDWLLFLHADTELLPGWTEEAERFMARQGSNKAAYFRFKLDSRGAAARMVETGAALRCRLLALPYGDQGFLIHRSLYDEVGGFTAFKLMEDVDLVRRIGRRRLFPLPAVALTSAERYEAGYARRVLRNAFCLGLYFLRVSPARIARLYAR